MSLTSGIPKFIAELEAAVRAAELAGAELVVKSAKDRVPYDPNTKHHVRDAIHTEETEDGVLVVAGNNKAWWGHLIEHGTVKQPPHPFLVPALEENRAAIIEGIATAIGKAA